ncbi:bacteriorhodopsin [Annulohypoxylon truncatum]|uniref:bacteriorhodopsin n=1 Tax=Annulohypoxylon truncatum TaxID=327061 RepID=UPI0020083540|nr:bacteriorhodopsin [Annulohypoxylon truncatum]KAI1209330.1 bacteriorhodopsin [Annulohypoxylon truncatum]
MSGPGNQALNVNSVVGQHGNLEITNRGSDWYYTVCSVMGLATLIFMGLSFRRAQGDRIFYYITAGITAVACIAYFSMGSNLGQVPILAEFIRPGSRLVRPAGSREIFYARYIDWAITTPLLLLDLLLTAGVPTPTILATLLADEIMIVTGLIGALTRTTYKWGFWTFGMIALFFIAYELLFDARRHAQRLGGDANKTFMMCGVFLLFIWFLYPIAWGLSEGGNVIHPDGEAVFYGILDILAKPIFGLLLIWGHRRTTSSQLGLRIRDRSQLTSDKYDPENIHRGVHPEGPGANVGGSAAGPPTITTTAAPGVAAPGPHPATTHSNV